MGAVGTMLPTAMQYLPTLLSVLQGSGGSSSGLIGPLMQSGQFFSQSQGGGAGMMGMMQPLAQIVPSLFGSGEEKSGQVFSQGGSPQYAPQVFPSGGKNLQFSSLLPEVQNEILRMMGE